MSQDGFPTVDLPDHTGTQTTTQSNGVHEHSLEELERELPVVFDGQVPLGDLLSRVMQSIYAELSELAETMPNMSDSARKRTLADWVVKTKKQIVKLYAVAKWARDASTVQKCMNITAFLMTQNQQFEDAIGGLNYAKESLDPARLRNHDLLTSLDVLTTGSYLRLPTCIKKMVVPLAPLTDSEVVKTLSDMEDVIRFRLRTTEIIPVEISQHRIADGRVYFTASKLFEVSLCLRGAQKEDGWFFVGVEFLINIGGGLTGLQDIPRVPTGIMAQHITNEADARLAYYLQLPEDPTHPSGAEVPPRPHLAEGVIDTPLVRLYNFLQMMSLSYQLEILWYQAERMRSLGWADYLTIHMDANRKTMVASYWIRSTLPSSQTRSRIKLPPFGGTLSISLVQTHASAQAGSAPERPFKATAISRLQQRSKLGNCVASDEVESLRFDVRWEPARGALGVLIPAEDTVLPENVLSIDANDLDFETLLRTVIERHTQMILKMLQIQLQQGLTKSIFSPVGIVSLETEAGVHALRVRLCADEIVVITVDSRTGRLNLLDTGDLAAAGRAPRFSAISEKLNENPSVLADALVRLRLQTITDLAEQKATYLGLQCFRRRNFTMEEMAKLGSSTRGTLYIQLCNFPNHYLVLVITDDRFRYALITTRLLSETMYSNMIMEDIAWLDFSRIHEEPAIQSNTTRTDVNIGTKRKRNSQGNYGRESVISGVDPASFNLETQVLRELYSYCCARVAYINVEKQLKLRGIPFTHVNPTNDFPVTKELAHIQSTFARSVPALCVQSKDILSGAPAAEAAMPNIRVIPLNWWSEKNAQVVTSVKLKYVQQPMGKSASTSTVIRPSKRIIYDTREAVVSFLSENVNTCVDEFLEEWARVSKMVVIAREVAQIAKETHWQDVRLLSFDLQTVEFTYALDYAVSISCEDQLSPTGGNFDLRFSRCRRPSVGSDMNQDRNPHDNAEPFLRHILRHGHGRLAPSIHRLVTLLRETLPIVTELEEIREKSQREGQNIDTYAKAAGWYRLLYGDLRHMLDFRLMTGQRVAILDGSRSLFDIGVPNSATNRRTFDEHICWQPIPGLEGIVVESVKELLSVSSVAPGNITNIGVGVICDTSTVTPLIRAIHTRVLRQLSGT